jgi:predicted secreted protein
VDLLEMLAREGARLCIVEVAGSPSCGVETTSSGYNGGLPGVAEHAHVAGWGVFIEELLVELERRSVPSRQRKWELHR